MTPVTPASRRRRTPSRSVAPPATRTSASWRRTRASSSAGVGRARAVAEDQAADAAARPAPRRSRRGSASTGAATGTRRAAPAGGRGRRRASRPRPRGSRQRLRPLDDGDRERRPASRRRRTRGARGRPPRGRPRPGAAPRPAPRPRRRPRGWRAPRCCAPSKSTRWRIRAPWATNCSAIRSGRSVGDADAGRGARPVHDPRASRLDVDRRDHVHRRQPSAAQQPAVEADRQRAVAQQRVVERPQGEGRAAPAALLLAQAEDQHLAQQVAQLVAGRVRVAADLGPGVGDLERRCARRGSRSPPRRVSSPRCIRTSRMIRQARQMASVYIATRKAGPASKPSSRIICSEYMPQPSTNSGASVSIRLRLGCAGRDGELEVVARVRLVDARVRDRAPVVLAHRVRVVVDGRRDDVQAARWSASNRAGAK